MEKIFKILSDQKEIGFTSESRKKCESIACSLEYYGFAFGQSPFHAPLPLANALAENADKDHYSDAEGIPKLREAMVGFNKRHFGLDVDDYIKRKKEKIRKYESLCSGNNEFFLITTTEDDIFNLKERLGKKLNETPLKKAYWK